jgi:hypothetical protein
MSEPIDLYAIAERLEAEASEAWRQSFRIDVPGPFRRSLTFWKRRAGSVGAAGSDCRHSRSAANGNGSQGTDAAGAAWVL